MSDGDEFTIKPDKRDEKEERMESYLSKSRLRAQVADLREGLMAGISQSVAILELLRVRVDYDHFRIWEDDGVCRKACEVFERAEELLACMSADPEVKG